MITVTSLTFPAILPAASGITDFVGRPVLAATILLICVLAVGLRRAVLVARTADLPPEGPPLLMTTACRWQLHGRPSPGAADWACAECGCKVSTGSVIEPPAGCVMSQLRTA